MSRHSYLHSAMNCGRLSLVLLCLLLTACDSLASSISKKQWERTVRVCYHYDCGSLAPQCKRDYTISIDEKDIIVKIYDYSNLLGEKHFDSSPELFNKVKAQLQSMNLGSKRAKKETPVCGGHTESVSCFAEGEDTPYFSAVKKKGGSTLVASGNVADVFTSVLPMPIREIIEEVAPTMRSAAPQRNPDRTTVSDEDWAATNYVCYSFTDASLPPEYHRSYSIGISKDSIIVNVTSYSRKLLHKVYPCTEETFNKVIARLAAQGISKGKAKGEATSTGGTTDALSFFKNNEDTPYFSASVYDGIGTLYIEEGSPADAFLNALPHPIEEIIDSTRDQ